MGCPRSGTSILSWALAAHPDFWTSDESDFLHYLFGRRLLRSAYERACQDPSRGWLPVNQVSYAEFAGALGLGIDLLFLNRSNQRRWVNSDPGYVLMADDLVHMFPRAQFVVMIRDGRAVVASMLKSGFQEAWAQDMSEACRAWVFFVREGQAFVNRCPERALALRLERFAEKPDECFRHLLGFLNAPHSDLPSNFMQSNRINSSYGNSAPGDIRKIKDPRQTPEKPWRQWSSQDKGIFRRICGPTMQELGYPMELD
jgi:protein-tyrosine sulfotransferase